MQLDAASPSGRNALSPETRSTAIQIARVICILGIVYAHGKFGTGAQEGPDASLKSIAYWFLVEVLGRSAVPLLSVISGWLVLPSVNRRTYPGFALNKARNLLAPMAAWNLINLFVIAVMILASNYRVVVEPVGLPLVNEILNLTRTASLNYQTSFLRDIFVCMLAAPLLVRLPTIALWAVTVAAFVWAIGDWHLYVLLRPQILAFFMVGIIARRGLVGLTIRQLPALVLLLAFAITSALKIWASTQGAAYHSDHAYLFAVIDNLLRLAAAAAYWRAALWLARSAAAPMLLNAERYIFIMFCSHLIVMRIIGATEAKFGFNSDNPLWLPFFAIMPAIAFATAWAIGRVLLKISPLMAGMLSGGRLTRGDRVPRPQRVL